MVKLDLFRDTFLELDPRLMNEFYGHGGFDLSRDAAASPSCKAKCPTSLLKRFRTMMADVHNSWLMFRIPGCHNQCSES